MGQTNTDHTEATVRAMTEAADGQAAVADLSLTLGELRTLKYAVKARVGSVRVDDGTLTRLLSRLEQAEARAAQAAGQALTEAAFYIGGSTSDSAEDVAQALADYTDSGLDRLVGLVGDDDTFHRSEDRVEELAEELADERIRLGKLAALAAAVGTEEARRYGVTHAMWEPSCDLLNESGM